MMQVAAKAHPQFESLDERGEDETRAGLRRLAELIREKRRSTDLADLPSKNDEGSSAPKSSSHQNPTKLVTLAGNGSEGVTLFSENRFHMDSHHLIHLILRWQERRNRPKSVADIILEELRRRQAISQYKKIAATIPQRETPSDNSGGLLSVTLS